MPVRSVKMGVAATYHTALERIGARAPAQAIPAAQKARLKCFVDHQRIFMFLVVTDCTYNAI